MISDLNPPQELLAKWGILAHVSEEERKHLLNLPAMKLKPALEILERELAALRKPKKKLSVATCNDYSKFKPIIQPKGEETHED